jgi:hypothetical protein
VTEADLGRTETTPAAIIAALNAVGVTPSAREVLTPYEQAFHATPEAAAAITALTSRARRARLAGLSQAQLARRAGIAPSTVSEVVDRLRHLDLVETTGGDYIPPRKRRTMLRYHLKWSPVIELTPARIEQGRVCVAQLEQGASPYAIRRLLVRSEARESIG